ncbi:LysR family transcriptional regulator [Vibrio sp. WXL103]|uniref:LysR family transcriptional regulator n=1 Tax=Vibrio sp. WXL103 TaxID=3450710 RepID=UPI003EC6A200
MLSIESINTFVTAAESKSFSAAAKKIGCSQAAVSTTIHNLEIDLNTTLFDRSNKYPLLTLSGKQLLSHAREMLGVYNDFVFRTTNIDKNAMSDVVIGIDPTLQFGAFMNGVNDFLFLHKGMHASIIQRGSGELINLLTQGELDIAIGVFQSEEIDNAIQIKLGSIQGEWVANPKFFEVDQLLLHSKLATTTLMTPANINESHLQELQYCQRHIEVESMNSLVTFATQGLGVAYMPSDLAKSWIEQGTLIKVFSFVNRENHDRWTVSLAVDLAHIAKAPIVDLFRAYAVDFEKTYPLNLLQWEHVE